MKKLIRIVPVLMAVTLLCPGALSQLEMTSSKEQTVYVPVYSHIYSGN